MSEHKRADGGGVVVAGSSQTSLKSFKWQHSLIATLIVIVLAASGFIIYKSFHHQDSQVAALNKQLKAAKASHSPYVQVLYQELAQRCATIHDLKCVAQANAQLAQLVPTNSLEYLMSAAATATNEGNKQQAIQYYMQAQVLAENTLPKSPSTTTIINGITHSIDVLEGQSSGH